MGVRPENVSLVRESGRAESLRGTVKGVQWLGSHTMVEVELVGSAGREQEAERVTWLSRICGRADYQLGEMVSIEIAKEKEHWFDAASGERISVGKTQTI